MISISHADIMDALMQTDDKDKSPGDIHITCLIIKRHHLCNWGLQTNAICIRENFNYSQTHRLRSSSIELAARPGSMDVNPMSQAQLSNAIKHLEPPSISHLKGPAVFCPNGEETNEDPDESLWSTSPQLPCLPETTLLGSIMNQMQDFMKIRSESSLYKNLFDSVYLFHNGLRYLGQVLKNTHLTSLGIGKNSLAPDLLIDFAKNLPETLINSLDLQRYNRHSQEEGMKFLETILKDTEITNLNLDENLINLKYLAHYLKDSKILSLSLRRCGIQGIQRGGLKFLADVLKDTQITTLDLSDNNLNCESLRILAPCLVSTKITSLSLKHNPSIGIDGLNCLAKVLKDTNITSLDVSHIKLDTEFLKTLALSLVDTKITTLKLSSSFMGSDGLKYLSQFLKNTQIRSIDLSPTDSKDETSMVLFLISLLDTKIRSLNLSGEAMNATTLRSLADVLKDSPISTLEISVNGRSNNDWANFFAPCLADSNIASISLKGVNANDVNCLAYVLKTTKITSINLSKSLFNNDRGKFPEPLSLYKNISHDNWCGTSMTKHELVNLGGLLENSPVTSIDLSDNHLCSESMKVLALSLEYSKLSCLNLSGNNMDRDGIKYLVSVLGHTQITSLSLARNYLECSTLTNLVMCLPDTKITNLNISGNPICCNAFYLASVLENTKITSLDLSNGCFDIDNQIDLIQKLNISDNLLDLSRTNMCPFRLFSVSTLSSALDITTLKLSNVRMKCDDMNYLSLGLVGSQIVSLDLSDNSIDWSGAFCLARRLKLTKISTLTLEKNKIYCKGLKYLAEGLVGSQVSSLNVSFNCIGDEGVRYLAKYLEKTQISHLYLFSNSITCRGVYYLSQVLHQIYWLNLSSNKIACDGVKYLAHGLQGSRMWLLNLASNSIGDEEVEYLAECLKFTSTQMDELDLRGNQISLKAAYLVCRSVLQSNLGTTVIVDLENKQQGESETQVPANSSRGLKKWPVKTERSNMFRYPGCFIEMNHTYYFTETLGHLINYANYHETGISKLILQESSSHLFGAFDNIQISEIEISGDLRNRSDILPVFQKSNVIGVEIKNCDKNSLNLAAQLNVISVQFTNMKSKNILSGLKTVLLDRSKANFSNIMYLDLRNNKLGDIENQIEYLAEALKGSHVMSLNLSNNSLGKEHIELLTQVLPQTKINYVDLYCNKIGYSGFKCLMNVVDKTRICWLSLGDNGIESELQENIALSPYIVPRANDTQIIEFQIRYLFRELVSLNTSNEFEFIIPREDSILTINHYPILVKHLLETPSLKIHVYDIFFMFTRRHDIHTLNKINGFIQDIKKKFLTFFLNELPNLVKRFSYDSFVDLVKECDENSNLTELVEDLLFHRVLYYVNSEQTILHPFIYKMLHKYGMTLYNKKMEPNKKQQIISYFERHTDIHGAQEIIELLLSLE